MIDQLRHRVEFRKPTVIPDGRGGWTEDWDNPIYSIVLWAAIYPLRGDERARYQAIAPEVDTLIIIRYHQEISNEFRAYHGDGVYGISAVIPPGELQKHMEIAAVRV